MSCQPGTICPLGQNGVAEKEASAIPRAAPQTVYATVSGGGIAKTVQGGRRWSLINAGLVDVGGFVADQWKLAFDAIDGGISTMATRCEITVPWWNSVSDPLGRRGTCQS